MRPPSTPFVRGGTSSGHTSRLERSLVSLFSLLNLPSARVCLSTRIPATPFFPLRTTLRFRNLFLFYQEDERLTCYSELSQRPLRGVCPSLHYFSQELFGPFGVSVATHTCNLSLSYSFLFFLFWFQLTLGTELFGLSNSPLRNATITSRSSFLPFPLRPIFFPSTVTTPRVSVLKRSFVCSGLVDWGLHSFLRDVERELEHF